MITLYHVPGARSARSLWLLHELGVEFELVEMAFDLKVLRAPEYLAIHPLGRVPCLVDAGPNGFRVRRDRAVFMRKIRRWPTWTRPGSSGAV